MVGDKRYWEINVDGSSQHGVIFEGCYCASDDEPPRRLIKLAPPPLKRIRPMTQMTPLALKLLAVGMARTMAGR